MWIRTEGVAACACSACSVANSSTIAIPTSFRTLNARPDQLGVLRQIVGVGDSLTAGYQSNGFLGATGLRNPNYAGGFVAPTQENGWWADLVEQASGDSIPKAIANMYDPSVSPLPLIKGPGLDNQLTPADSFPFNELKSGDACTDNNGFNQAGFKLGSAPRTKLARTRTPLEILECRA